MGKSNREDEAEPERPQDTPIHTRIEQMLTETRVLIPGAQALLGFQLVAMLNKTFEQLPASSKIVHIGALFCVALAVILLMTPAAIHRIAFAGEDSARFHRIGSHFMVAASVPLGVGIAAEMYVAVTRATDWPAVGAACAGVIAVILAALWYVQPLLLRQRVVQ
jgi:hypothetical protein